MRWFGEGAENGCTGDVRVVDQASVLFLAGVRTLGATAGRLAGPLTGDVLIVRNVDEEQARAPLQRQELIERVRDWVRMSPMFWEQDPYRRELFRLCKANIDVGGNQLADALRGQLPETTLHRLVLVWNAWRYALERL
jgi:hypothetical protein